jgi:hypothetical protein
MTQLCFNECCGIEELEDTVPPVLFDTSEETPFISSLDFKEALLLVVVAVVGRSLSLFSDKAPIFEEKSNALPGVFGVFVAEPKDANAPDPSPKALLAPLVGDVIPAVESGAILLNGFVLLLAPELREPSPRRLEGNVRVEESPLSPDGGGLLLYFTLAQIFNGTRNLPSPSCPNGLPIHLRSKPLGQLCKNQRK